MAIPLITNLKLWVGTLFTKDDWDFNFRQIVSWLADGNADLVVNSVKATNGLDLDGATIKNVGAAQEGSEAVNLDQALTLLNRSSYYYPFSVASGKVNSNGEPAFLQKDSDTQVTVLAGNTNPDLVCIQSDATIESVTSNTILTVPSSDGTYHIIKEKEAAITITSGASSKMTVDLKFPTSPSIGDYFLDNSCVPFKGYKYTANGWEETAFCWLGDVSVSSGTATVKARAYNNNYFDGVIKEYYFSYQYSYIRWSNGLLEQWGKFSGTIGNQTDHSYTMPKSYSAASHYTINVSCDLYTYCLGANVDTANKFVYGARYFDDDMSSHTDTATIYWHAIGF